MKLYPNRDKIKLYTRSMGKLFLITAIFDNDNEANVHMSRNNEATVIACTGSLVILASQYDSGFKP